MTKKHWLVACGILLALFVGLRLPLLSQIYHQDEFKWAMDVDFKYHMYGSIPHPPFAETLYMLWGQVFHYDWLRVVPLIFACFNLLLGLALARRWFGEKAAIWFGVLFVVMTASLHAATQVDIDGAFLPFWTLIAFWAATDLKDPEFRKRGMWLMALACIGGFLTKLSFALVPVTLIAEAIFDGRLKIRRNYLLGALGLGIIGLCLWISPLLDGFLLVRYAKGFGFLNLLHRDYFELLLLSLKSLVLLGPAAVLAVLAAVKQPKRYLLMILFVASQLLFYIVLFDFTHRTLERYMLVLAFPIAVVVGDFLARHLTKDAIRDNKAWLAAALFLAAFAFITFGLPKDAIPLHPKEQFVHKVAHLDFGFLIPISGGSGPIGFFVPTDATIYAFAIVSILSAWFVFRGGNKRILIPLIAMLLVFPLLTDEEFALGVLYGNASVLAKRAIAWVNANPDISQVITYNDIGGWELHEGNKYFKRFYLNPEFQASTQERMAGYDGFYLVVGMPPLPPDDPSVKYFGQCKDAYHQTDKKIAADVYDCRGVKYAP
ncbi:MAG TPA: hypothetical protein VMU11_00880 [Verrucomicrobiae bacterium]|nr:hypothetical protein [Verrucomicrobiae bacterium]